MSEATGGLEGPDLAKGVALSDLGEGVPFVGHALGQAVLLVRQGEQVSAVGALCTHWHLALASGLVVGNTIRCPFHHACFDLQSGAVVGAPALDPLPSFDVVRDGDRVRVGELRFPAVAPHPARSPSSIVIVGAGAAGAACAETLRVEGYTGPITMLGDEAPVDRPNLSKDYLTGKADPAWMPLRSPSFYQDRQIALTTGDRVVRCDPLEHRVWLESGRALPYGALVLATGATASTLPIDGATLPHVLRLRSLADADAILARVGTARDVVVVGASFIALEVAASLRIRGVAVTVVAPEAVPMLAALGEEVGTYFRSIHEAKGVSFRLGRRPVRVRLDAVDLDDGSSIRADLVVLGVGVQPQTAIAEGAGLALDRGIVVDALFRTSAPDVYAVGDVARHPFGGEMVRIEHWVVAMRQGRALARGLVGRGSPYRDVPFFWSQHYDVVISVVGHAERWESAEVYGVLADGDATVAYRREGRILAVATIGRNAASLAAESAMERGDSDAVERIVAAAAGNPP